MSAPGCGYDGAGQGAGGVGQGAGGAEEGGDGDGSDEAAVSDRPGRVRRSQGGARQTAAAADACLVTSATCWHTCACRVVDAQSWVLCGICGCPCLSICKENMFANVSDYVFYL